MAKSCHEIGLSNLQAIWVEVEDVRDVLQKPTVAGYILPRGNATMSQTPGQSDSQELSESLNTTEQFQNAVEAGTASIPMYLRVTDDGSRMQGHALLYSAMGGFQEADTVTAALNETSGIDDKATTFAITDVAGGIFPPRCVIQIDDEKILVGDVVKKGDVVMGVKHCVRGYMDTTPADHADDATITVKSKLYYQDTCRETVSIWMRFDHVVIWGRGGSVTATTVPTTNEGGQNVDYNVSFKEMGWAGVGFISGDPVGKTITVKTENGGNAGYGYTVGAYVKNTTQDDDNNGAGYRISAVNRDASTITIDGTITDWADGDKIEPWTPKAEAIGHPVESRTALVFVNGIAGGIREGSFTMNTPTEYKNLIGDMYPRFNVDTKRSISLSMGSYFDKAAAVTIGRGYEGYETPVSLVFGPKEGRRINITLPRVKLNTPTIGTDGAAFTLERTGTILGRGYEDAVYIATE